MSINDRFFSSLEEGYIYFAPQSKLNDPFDCNINIKNSILNAVKLLKGRPSKQLKDLLNDMPLFDSIQENLNKFGICSFCYEVNDFQTLLWSRYADDHNGACVMYEMSESFLKDDSNNIFGVSKITYETNPLTKWFKEIAAKLPTISQKELVNDLVKKILTSKSPPWSYESEIRIIRPISGVFNIPKDLIKQIIFGLQASDANIEKVKQIVSGFNSGVKLYKMTRGKEDFGIKYRDI